MTLELEHLPLILAAAGACIASYTDLRRRIIHNKLTFSMIGVGIAFYALLGVHQGNLWVASSGLLGAALTFAIGYALWLTGAWAGGDVKLFTAFGALVPAYTAPRVVSPLPFPLTIMLNTFLMAALVLGGYLLVSFARKRLFGAVVRPIVKRPYRIAEGALIVFGGGILGQVAVQLTGITWLLWPVAIPFIIIMFILPIWVRLPPLAALSIYGFYLAPVLAAKIFIVLLSAVAVVWCIVSAASVANREVLQRNIKVTDLREGMIPAEVVYEKNGKVRRTSEPSFGGFVMRSKLPGRTHVLADPRFAGGLSRHQVGVLRRLVRAHKLKNRIRVKRGVPFAPALGAGLLVGLAYGDLYWALSMWLGALIWAI